MSSIELSQEQMQQIQNAMLGFLHRKKLFEAIGGVLMNDALMNFRTSRGPDGQPWAPVVRKRPGQPAAPGRPLVDTGRLRNSITFRATEDEVEVGTNVIYARIHQFGHAEKNIKARPFFGLEARQIKKINRVLTDWAASVAGGEQSGGEQ